MLKTVIEKEIREIIGSTKFVITFGVCAFLIIIAFYVGAARQNLYLRQYEASQSENLRAVEGLTEWDEVEGTRIFLPPQPLASLVSGVSNDIGRSVYIAGRGEPIAKNSRYNEDPIYAVFRYLDLEFIFKVVLSLFAILLGFNAISGEKENGTLRLTFANALPRHTYILGKLIGSFTALTVSILLAMAIGVLIMFAMGVSLTGSDWPKLLLIILTGLLYFGVFLTMSIFVSALTHRSSNSFLILLIIWVLCIHVIPRASVLLAARSVNVPSVDEQAYQKSTLGLQLADEFFDGMSNFEGGTNDIPPDQFATSFNEYIDSLSDIRTSKMDELTKRLNEDRRNRQMMQEKLAFTIARISPATSLTLASANLAGTSLALKNRFTGEAANYQNQFGQFIKEKTGMNPGGFLRVKVSVQYEGEGEPEKPEPIDPNEIPKFDFKKPTLAQAVGGSITDMGILAFFNLLFFAGTFVAFVKYDLR